MFSYQINDGVYSVGVMNPNLRVFDIVMKTDYGTSYNSYLIKGNEKTALIETCHKTYYTHFLNNIKEVCDPAKIDYIILNHNEPDHSGSLAQLLNDIPNATILVSQAGSIYIKSITNRNDLKVQVVKDGETLDLGGKTLKFINAPFLHWPDSMFTWLEEDKTLFPCDFFGSHFCEPQVMDYNIVYPEKYETAFQGYYDAIMGPFKPYVLKGLEKISDLDIEFICTSHGPVITKGCRLDYVREKYYQWSQPCKNEVPVIPVFYVSAYGNTRLVAQSIQEGILSVLPQAECKVFDVIDYDISDMRAKLAQSDAFAVGSPTINRDALPPIWDLINHVDAINIQKKPCLVFGSYGWSGEAVPFLTQRLNALKLKVFGEGYKVCFVPSDEDLQKAKELGIEFAKTLQ